MALAWPTVPRAAWDKAPGAGRKVSHTPQPRPVIPEADSPIPVPLQFLECEEKEQTRKKSHHVNGQRKNSQVSIPLPGVGLPGDWRRRGLHPGHPSPLLKAPQPHQPLYWVPLALYFGEMV